MEATLTADVQGHGTVIGLPRGSSASHEGLAQLAETVSHMMKAHGGVARLTLFPVSPGGRSGHLSQVWKGSFSLRREIMWALEAELADCGVKADRTRGDMLRFSYVGHGRHAGALILVTEGCSDSAHRAAAGEVLRLIARFWAEWASEGEFPHVVGSARVRDPKAALLEIFGPSTTQKLAIGTWRDPLHTAFSHVARELTMQPATNEDLFAALGLRRCALTEDLFAAACAPDTSPVRARSLALHFAETLLYEVFATDPFAKLQGRATAEVHGPQRSRFWAQRSGAPVPVALCDFRLEHLSDLQARFNAFPCQMGHVRLFHGADKLGIGSIIMHGIDHDSRTSLSGTDFGQGFYTTPDLWMASKIAGLDGAIVAFDVPQEALDNVTEDIAYPEPWTAIVRNNILFSRLASRPSRPVLSGRISKHKGNEFTYEADSEGKPAKQYVFRLLGSGLGWLVTNAILVCAIGSEK